MKRLLLLVLAIVAVCGAALLWLTATRSGLAFVIARIENAVPGLSIGRVDGSITAGATLSMVIWRGDGLALEVDAAGLRASLPALLRGRYEFDAVTLAGVRFVRTDVDDSSPDREASAPIELPALSIAALGIRDATIAINGRSLAINDAEAKLKLSGSRIAFDALRLTGQPLSAQGRGLIDFGAAFPIAELDLALAHAATPDKTWRGHAKRLPASGDPALRIELNAPLAATVVATPAGDGRIATVNLAIAAQDGRAIGLPGALAADLVLDIDGADIVPRGSLTIAGRPLRVVDGGLGIGATNLALADLAVDLGGHGRIVIAGRLPFADTEPLALTIITDGFDVEAADGRRVRAAGRILAVGTRRAPQISPELVLSSPGWPDGRVSGHIDISTSGARLHGLVLETAGSRVRVDGVLAFGSDSAFRAKLSGFDPALLNKDWPGRIDAEFVMAGRHADGLTDARIYLVDLAGTLRGAAVAGGGQLAWAGNAPGPGRLVLTWGTARLRADVHDTLHGELEVMLPDVGMLVSGSQGRAELRWQRGADERIVAQLSAYAQDGFAVDTARLEARRDLGRDAAFKVDIELSGGRSGVLVLERAKVAASGRESAHALDVELLLGDGVTVDAHIEGALAGRRWAGRLDRARIDGFGARGDLVAPVQLAIAPERVLLDNACWAIASGEVCLRADGNTTDANIAARLSGLSLAALRKLAAGVELPEFEGLVDCEADVDVLAGRVAAAKLAISSPRGIAVLPGRDDLDLGYQRLNVDARYADGAGTVAASAELVPAGRIDFNADIDTDAAGKLGWDARVAVMITDLTFIEAFTTAVAEPVGDLRGQFRIQGGSRPHSISGAVAITGFTALMPAQAIRLREGVLAVAGVPGQLIVRGSVRSGDGTLAIDGRIVPADPIPALLTIRGDGVRLANTPTLMLIASPDLELKLTAGRWNLDGTVVVPRARIDAAKTEARAEASPDVIVVDDPAIDEPPRPWRARVRVTLGDDVRLEGFGFKGTVAGSLDIRQRQGAQALATGEITLAGRYAAYGQRLTITRGGLRYANSPLSEPTIDLRAERKVRDQTVALEVTGSVLAPQSRIVGGSGSDADALAQLVTGRPLAQVGIGDRDRLGEAASALGVVGSDLLTQQLRGRLGLDELGVSNDTRIGGEVFTLGKFLSPRLYVGYGIGLVTRGEIFTVRYLVTDRLDIEASSGASERAALNWRLER